MQLVVKYSSCHEDASGGNDDLPGKNNSYMKSAISRP